MDANSAKPSVSPDSGWNVVIINRECTVHNRHITGTMYIMYIVPCYPKLCILSQALVARTRVSASNTDAHKLTNRSRLQIHFVFPSNSVVTRSCWTKPWILRRHHTKYIHCTAMVASHMSWWHHTKYIDTLHCHGGCSKWLRLASSEYDVRYASYDVE